MIDGQMGSHELNGNDARAILGIVFNCIEEGAESELRSRLTSVGYGKPEGLAAEVDRIVADDSSDVNDRIRNITNVFRHDQGLNDGNYSDPEKQTASLYDREKPFSEVETDAMLNQSRPSGAAEEVYEMRRRGESSNG